MFEAFDDYQARAILTAAVKQNGRARKAHAGLEFASEALELAALVTSNVTKSQFRPKGKLEEEFKSKLKDELGDALWCVANLAAAFGLRLADVAKENIEKVGAKHVDLKGGSGGRTTGGRSLQEPKGALGVPAKPKDPFPWTKGNKKAITKCPSCGQGTKFEEGCVSCVDPGCGWSGCS